MGAKVLLSSGAQSTGNVVVSAATSGVLAVTHCGGGGDEDPDTPAVITGDTSYNGVEGDAVAGDLNATDVDGLTDGDYFSISKQAGNGVAAINSLTGAWTFTPINPNWFGMDNFEVTVTDDLGGTTKQRIDIILANVDDPGVITGDTSYVGNEGDVVSGDLDAMDVDGLMDGTYFSVTSQTTNGIAVIDPATGVWTFTPTDPNWFGSDSFEVTLTDDEGGTTTQVVSITLANVDDPAVITGDTSYNGVEGDTVAGDLNATDVDGLTNLTPWSVTSQATFGVGAINAATGAWTFVPTDPEWFGSDSFVVTVTDDLGGTTTQIITITLSQAGDTPAVITGDTSYVGDEGDAVAGDLNATDVDGLTNSTPWSVTSQATHGTAAINSGTGAWTFTPTDSNWFGSDSFEVTVTDDGGGTTTQVVTIDLANVDDPAVITGDTSYVGNEGDAVAGDLNATDVDGLTNSTPWSVTSQATFGVGAINSGTGAWTFTPTDPNWFGSDSFVVTVTDDLGGTTTQVITIDLANVDDPAVITGDTSYNGVEGDTVAGDLNATDVDGLTNSTPWSVTSQATFGVGAINAATGAWTFTPTDPNWFGSDSFVVTVTDDEGGTTIQVVSITLAEAGAGPGDPPPETDAVLVVGMQDDNIYGNRYEEGGLGSDYINVGQEVFMAFIGEATDMQWSGRSFGADPEELSVFLNGNFLGYMTGCESNAWCATLDVFTLPAVQLIADDWNLIEVRNERASWKWAVSEQLVLVL